MGFKPQSPPNLFFLSIFHLRSKVLVKTNIKKQGNLLNWITNNHIKNNENWWIPEEDLTLNDIISLKSKCWCLYLSWVVNLPLSWWGYQPSAEELSCLYQLRQQYESYTPHQPQCKREFSSIFLYSGKFQIILKPFNI